MLYEGLCRFSTACWFTPAIWALSALANHGASIALADEDSTFVEAKVIANGYLSNREAFPFVTCRFTLSDGYAAGEQEALEKGPTKDVVGRECVWIVNGDKIRYEIGLNSDIEASQTLTEHEGGLVATGFRLQPEQLLRNEPYQLGTNRVLGSGAILSRGDGVDRKDESRTPWNMAGMVFTSESETNPAWLITRASEMAPGNPNVDLRVEHTVGKDGSTLQKVMIEGGYLGYTYLMDPTRGYLPIEMWHSADGNVERKGFITDVRECSGSRWFPGRCVAVEYGPGGASDEVYVIELCVTALDVDNPPKDEDLAIEVAARTKVWNGVDVRSTVTFDKPERIHADSLRDLYETARNTAVTRRARKVRAMDESQWSPLRSWLIGLNVVAVSVLAIYMFGRRMRRRTQS
jgi:hypothetical protein